MKKFSKQLIVGIAVLVLFQVLAATAYSQVWRVRLEGCLHGNRAVADIDLQDYLVRTRNPMLDASISQDIDQLNQMFGIRVAVYFPNDGMKDASFTPQQSAELILREDMDPSRVRLTGSIFISLGLLQDEFTQANGSWMAVPAILSHEAAHAMQHANNFPYKNGVRKELHADFMAGWYIAHRCRCGTQNPKIAFDSFYRKGTSLGFFDPDHHGTNEDRVAMMLAGFYYNYQTNDGSAKAAYDHALRIVSSW
ncbi:MAG: hypothetical protein WAM70_08695 [Pyrinomonadaceae bacterium]